MCSSRCPTTRSMSSTSRRTRPRLSAPSQSASSLPVLASTRPATSRSSPIAATNSISVLSIKGTDVKLIDTVPMGDSVAHVTFTPDGKRALAVKFPAHKVAVLDVDGRKVTSGEARSAHRPLALQRRGRSGR